MKISAKYLRTAIVCGAATVLLCGARVRAAQRNEQDAQAREIEQDRREAEQDRQERRSTPSWSRDWQMGRVRLARKGLAELRGFDRAHLNDIQRVLG